MAGDAEGATVPKATREHQHTTRAAGDSRPPAVRPRKVRKPWVLVPSPASSKQENGYEF